MKSYTEADASTILAIVTDLIANSPEKVGKLLDKFGRPVAKNSRSPFIGGSIANYANKLTMTFPMLIDNSLDPEICSMLSRANERNIVTMLHLLFSAEQFNSTSGAEVIKSIYGELKPNMSMTDFIDQMSSYVSTSRNNPNYSAENLSHEMADMMKDLTESMDMNPAFEMDSISERSISDFTVRNINGNMVVTEDGLYDKDKNGFIFQKTKKNSDGKLIGTLDIDGLTDDHAKFHNDYRAKSLQYDISRQSNDLKIAQNDRQAKEFMQQNALTLQQRRILDSDVKKANELQPTLLTVQYNELDTDGTIRDVPKYFVAGVKSRVISVDPADIIDRVVVKNKTKLSFLNFIRATTGEIKFIKDFVLSLDQAKIDAKNSVKKGEAAQLWKALEALSAKNTLNNIRKRGNDASAITTLVVNKETANLLKKQYKINLEQPATARGLLDSYNLLGLMIVDESTETVKTIYRGNAMFDQQAFSYLEKEDNDKSYKKVINLMGQINRGY